MGQPRTYVIADLHGRFDLLMLAWARIQADADKYDAIGTVVCLGDYIDRGPQSMEVLAFLRGGLPQPWGLICLKGNHEDMMVDAIESGMMGASRQWISNGGTTTLTSFGVAHEDQIDTRLVSWVKDMPLLHADEQRVYVHAGVDETRGLDEQIPQFLMWTRQSMENGYRGRFIVHGHTPGRDPWQTPGSLNLDTGAFRTGRLVVGVFDNTQPGPIGFIDCVLPEG